jgi:hypothetical protein
MKKLLLASAALVALTGPALSGTTTGLSLIKYCTGESLPFCRGYLLGVADEASLCGMNAAVKLGTINVEQLRAIMINYLRRNPQKWNQSGSDLVTAAFEEAWPCKVPQVDYLGRPAETKDKWSAVRAVAARVASSKVDDRPKSCARSVPDCAIFRTKWAPPCSTMARSH